MAFDGPAVVMGEEIHLQISNKGDATAKDVCLEWSIGPYAGNESLGDWDPGRTEDWVIIYPGIEFVDAKFKGEFHYNE